MAIDNTPPRLKLIVTIAVITVITLVAIDFAFKSYYSTMSDIAYREKTAPPKDRDDQHKAELASLAGGAMPVEKAMAQLAGARPDAISPQASDDLGAVTGWSKLPHPAPVPLAPASHDAPAPGTLADGGAAPMDADGGANAAGDGGALPLATDGGAAALGMDAGKPTTTATKPDAGKQH